MPGDDDVDDIPELVSLSEHEASHDDHMTSCGTDPSGLSQSSPAAGAALQNIAPHAYGQELEGQKVPVTIVTGFLGAGKSTLLRHILTAAHGRRIAVLVNEFGDTVDVEREIRLRSDTLPPSEDGAGQPGGGGAGEEGATMDDWIELPNGCMCCTMKDGAIRALESLMARASAATGDVDNAAAGVGTGDKRPRPIFDHIVIETTGLADPTPIVNMFWLDDAVLPTLALDGVVTVVDAVNLRRTLLLDPAPRQHHSISVAQGEASADAETCKAQISVADVVVLNKCDMLSVSHASAKSEGHDGDVAALTRQMNTVNPFAKVVPTSYGQTALDHLLDLAAYDAGRIDRQIAAMQIAPPDDCGGAEAAGRKQPGEDEHGCGTGYNHDHDHEHGHEHERHSETVTRSHVGAVKTAKLEFPPLRSVEDVDAVESIFQRVLWRHTTQTVTDWADSEPVADSPAAVMASSAADTSRGPAASGSAAAGRVDILRTKGRLLATDDRSAAWILQGVRDVYELVKVPRAIDLATAAGAEEVCKVVFIGRMVETPLTELARALRQELGIAARLG